MICFISAGELVFNLSYFIWFWKSFAFRNNHFCFNLSLSTFGQYYYFTRDAIWVRESSSSLIISVLVCSLVLLQLELMSKRFELGCWEHSITRIHSSCRSKTKLIGTPQFQSCTPHTNLNNKPKLCNLYSKMSLRSYNLLLSHSVEFLQLIGTDCCDFWVRIAFLSEMISFYYIRRIF